MPLNQEVIDTIKNYVDPVAEKVDELSTKIEQNIVLYNENGGVTIPEIPTENTDAASKGYVDSNFVVKPTSAQGVLTSDGKGNITVQTVGTNEARPYSIVARTAGGVIYAGTPTEAAHAATKEYVDSKTGTQLYAHEFTWSEYDDFFEEWNEYKFVIYNTVSSKVDLDGYYLDKLYTTMISAFYYPEVSGYNDDPGLSASYISVYTNIVYDEETEEEDEYTFLEFYYQEGARWDYKEARIAKYGNPEYVNATYTVKKV